jgi:hypothetical protein
VPLKSLYSKQSRIKASNLAGLSWGKLTEERISSAVKSKIENLVRMMAPFFYKLEDFRPHVNIFFWPPDYHRYSEALFVP